MDRSYFVFILMVIWPALIFWRFRPEGVAQKFWRNILAYSPIAMFASLRGLSGTDTENYRIAYAYAGSLPKIELGPDYIFSALMHYLSQAGFPFEIFSLVQSLMCAVLFAIAGAKIDESQPVFSLGIVPTALIDATFNGLRSGLAFALMAALIAFLYKRRNKFIGLIFTLPAGIHSSLAMISLISLPSVIVFSILGYFYSAQSAYNDMFFNKVDSYTNMFRPSPLSGVVPLAATLFSIYHLNRLRYKWISFQLGSISAVIAIGGYVMSIYTYAGLRILLIGAFFIALEMSIRIANNRRALQAMLFLYALYSLNFLRQVFYVGAEGGVLFAPYDFFFEYPIL